MIEATKNCVYLAAQLDAEMRQQGFERWELGPVADRKLVTELREELEKTRSALLCAEDRVNGAKASFGHENARNQEARRVIDKQLAEIATHHDFMAFMALALAAFPCCHEAGEHKGTPPMMWPELIACIAMKARRTAEEERAARPSTKEALAQATIDALGDE